MVMCLNNSPCTELVYLKERPLIPEERVALKHKRDRLTWLEEQVKLMAYEDSEHRSKCSEIKELRKDVCKLSGASSHHLVERGKIVGFCPECQGQSIWKALPVFHCSFLEGYESDDLSTRALLL